MYRSYLQNYVPACCNGNPEYNTESGCGKIEAEAVDYCNGGDFDSNAAYHYECRSPVERENNPAYDEDVESCHTDECRSSEFGCIAARGKMNKEKPGKNYSMQLKPEALQCGVYAAHFVRR
jgi:hypothetical protein